MYVGSVATLLSQIRGGKVRALGVVATDRSPALPDVPTVDSGYPTINQFIWWGLMAPGKTPDDVVATLNQALRKVQAKPELVKKLEDAGYTVMSGTPADLAQRHRADHDVFGRWSGTPAFPSNDADAHQHRQDGSSMNGFQIHARTRGRAGPGGTVPPDPGGQYQRLHVAHDGRRPAPAAMHGGAVMAGPALTVRTRPGDNPGARRWTWLSPATSSSSTPAAT